MPGDETVSSTSSTSYPASYSFSLDHSILLDPTISSMTYQNKPTTPYCKYALVKLGGLAGVALIDSGNTWRTVISCNFAKQLGLDLEKDLKPLAVDTIGTAKSGETLDIIGEPFNYLTLTFSPLLTKFKVKPVVVRNLSMNINISGPFLRRHHIDQLHSKDCLKVQGHTVPLYASLPHITSTEKLLSNIILSKRVVIPPNSWTHCLAYVQEICEGHMPIQDGAVIGSIDFMSKFDCHPWINAIVRPNDDGIIHVGIMNTQAHPIEIQANTLYGQYRLLCNSNQKDRFPWRVSLIQTDSSSSKDHKVNLTDDEKLARLNDLFNLSKNSNLKTDVLKAQAGALLLKYWDTFSFDGSFGATSLLEHKIYTEDNPPINLRYRPINPSLEPHLKQQIDDWLKHDVIEESQSPYNFPLVCVKKKNGKFRWCVDYRALNKISKRDTYPIGNIEDNLARLANSTIFSGLDGSGAFHVVPLSQDSKEKTAFSTPFGLYQFKRLPFGLANGPSTYARLIKMVLAHIPTSIAIPYLDDTIIHSPNISQHFRDLAKVLEAHKQAGLKLQPSKCQLFQSSIDYLGHRVSEQGIAPLKSHTEIIKTWPMPTNRNEIRTFLGKVGYYRRFIKSFASLARPLTDKLSQDGTDDKHKFDITPEMSQAFHNLRTSLLTAPILAYPQFQSPEPFILDTDWSYENAAIGAVLLQKQKGLERVIAYGAHKLAKSQRNYPPTKGELFAIVYFVNHYKYYLAHRPFIIRTDHQALKHMAKMEPPSGMITRWFHLLANYTFTIEHRAGKRHQNADALSRCTHLSNDVPEPQLVDEVVSSLGETSEWTATFLRNSQLDDSDISFLFPLLRNEQKVVPDDIFASLSHNSRLYANLFSSLELDSFGIIRYTLPRSGNPFSQPRKVYLMPKNLIFPSVMRAHKQIAHLSAKATYEKLRLYAFFPNMLRIIREIILRCSACQTKTTRLPDQHHTLKSKVVGFPFQTLSLDFVGPFPASNKKQYTYLLTIKDLFTKWIEAFPLRQANSKEVMRIMGDEIFSRYGKCEQIHTDRGTPFISKEFKQFCEIHKIRLTQTPAYNPKSNPVERVHRDIKAALMALASNKPTTWADYIPQILYALRTMKNRSTQFSPFQLMFGRYPIDDLDTLYYHPQNEINNLSLADFVSKHREQMDQAFHLARANMKLAIERQRRSYYRKQHLFEKGQKAWLFTPILGQRQTTKLNTGWSGPWEIIEVINDVTYRIKATHFPYPKTEVVSIDRLRRCYDDDDDKLVLPPESGQSVSMNDDFFVQSPYTEEEEHQGTDKEIDTSHPQSMRKRQLSYSVDLGTPSFESNEMHDIPSHAHTTAPTAKKRKPVVDKHTPVIPNERSSVSNAYTKSDQNKTFSIPNNKSRIFGSYAKSLNDIPEEDFMSPKQNSPIDQLERTPPNSPNRTWTPPSSPQLNSPSVLQDPNSILQEPYEQYLQWDKPADMAHWMFSEGPSGQLMSSTPEHTRPTNFFNKQFSKPDANGKLTADQCAHDRRLRYELRTGTSRDDTLEGMKSTKTPPPSPVMESDLANETYNIPLNPADKTYTKSPSNISSNDLD